MIIYHIYHIISDCHTSFAIHWRRTNTYSFSPHHFRVSLTCPTFLVFSFRVSALLFAQNGKFGKLGKNVSSFTMDMTQTLDLEFPCIMPGKATNNFLLLIFFLNPDWILINIDISPQDILGGYYSLLLVPNQGCFNWSSWTSTGK